MMKTIIIVKEEKENFKDIVVIIPHIKRIIGHRLFTKFGLMSSPELVFNALNKIPESVKGIASCNLNEDKFDYDYGVKLATRRAHYLFESTYGQVLREIASKLTEQASQLIEKSDNIKAAHEKSKALKRY